MSLGCPMCGSLVTGYHEPGCKGDPTNRIHPGDLRVECWGCGGYGGTTSSVIIRPNTLGQRVLPCAAPGCKNGLRLPHKVDI